MQKVKLSVKKRERQNLRRKRRNLLYKKKIKDAIKKFLKAQNSDKFQLLREIYEVVDKAVKKGVIHRNKGDRIKSKYAKLCFVKQDKEK